MLEDVATTDLLGHLRAFDFDDLPAQEHGFARVEAIKTLDRAIRAAQAEQVTHINALHDDRTLLMGIGRGDPTLSVIGEIGITKWRTPTGHEYVSRPPPVIRQ